jgi:hypothetical protein
MIVRVFPRAPAARIAFALRIGMSMGSGIGVDIGSGERKARKAGAFQRFRQSAGNASPLY